MLGRFIPDFGRIVAMMQFNMYHHYTVDEHLLRAIGILSSIESGRLREEHPVASEIIASIANRTVLYVALLLHDIAKGRPGGPFHRRRRRRAPAVPAPRPVERRDRKRRLARREPSRHVEHRPEPRSLRPRHDRRPSRRRCRRIERLRLLLVLTVCDIRAVGPGVWNGWKGQLLRTLYWEAELLLTGGHSAIDRKQRVERAQEELRRALPLWSDPDFDAYAARHYQAYWLKVDLAHKVKHAQLLRVCEVEMKSLATEVATDEFHGVTELTVVAPDHPRLLSIIAGACATAGANIVDAQIFTTTDGLALDTISISRAFDRDEDELRRGERVAKVIEKALRGEIRLTDAMAEKAKGAIGPRADVPARARRDDRQQSVEPVHGHRGLRPRPARPALRSHLRHVAAQPQHRLGAHRHLRREGGGRLLRHRHHGAEDRQPDPAGGHSQGADRRSSARRRPAAPKGAGPETAAQRSSQRLSRFIKLDFCSRRPDIRADAPLLTDG